MPLRQQALPRHDAGAQALSATPAWPVAALQERLRLLEPGLELQVVAEIGSTNTALVERARADAPGPAVPRLLVAEQQTQGRGRQGRVWQSSRAASLTFSLALPLAPADWSGLSLAVGLALAEALEPLAAGAPPRLVLKWPNDLWLRDDSRTGTPGRKLGGVLIETVACGAQRVGVVGVGLNLRPQSYNGLASGYASLDELARRSSGPLPDGPGVLAIVAPALLTTLRRFEHEGLTPFAAAYAARDLLRGRAVTTTLHGLPEGRAEGIDADGALWVTDAAGTRHAVHAGEVSIRPASAQGSDVTEESAR